MTFDEAVQKVEVAGYCWAIEGFGGSYSAIVEPKGDKYVADSLATGLGAESGKTPTEALLRALEHALRPNG